MKLKLEVKLVRMNLDELKMRRRLCVISTGFVEV